MKKIIVITFVLMFCASSAFAATMASNTVSAAGLGIYGGTSTANAEAAVNPLVKCSSGVSAIVVFDAAGGAYALGTKHLKGSKIFATANDSTTLYWSQGESGTALAVGAIGTSSADADLKDVAGMTAY